MHIEFHEPVCQRVHVKVGVIAVRHLSDGAYAEWANVLPALALVLGSDDMGTPATTAPVGDEQGPGRGDPNGRLEGGGADAVVCSQRPEWDVVASEIRLVEPNSVDPIRIMVEGGIGNGIVKIKATLRRRGRGFYSIIVPKFKEIQSYAADQDNGHDKDRR